MMNQEQTHCQSQTLQWDKQLISKYDTRGPRYTSYPTAAQFTSAFTENDYIKALGSHAQEKDDTLSLYIHIPFCKDICYYCACNKIVTRNTAMADEYLTYLEKEMALLQQHVGNQRAVAQLHLGGGSPTFLSPGQLTRLVHSLAKYFQLVEGDAREYSIEIDPRTVSTDTLALLKGLGFNRISIGVQDFSPAVQKAVNRINSFAMVEDLVLAARDYGFKSINIDMIYGLPQQNIDNLTDTLEKIITVSPDRIAFYNYAHLPERFTSQRAIDRQTLPTPEQKLAMIELISEKLTAAGYLYIGMDHFVKPSDALAVAQEKGKLQRNFQGYSTSHSSELIGMGVSSISSGKDFFAQNEKNLDDYYAALNKNRLPIERGLWVNADDSKRASVIMALIGNLSFDIRAWEKQFACSFADYFPDELQALRQMEKDELLTVGEAHIDVLPKGRALIRSICMVFDAYTVPQSAQFSRIL